MDFTVLFVCTGNICRSPLGERLLESRLDGSVPIRVTSAGTAAVVGMGIDAPSARALRDLGVVGDGHVAQQLTAGHITEAGLILTAESVHRSTILRVDPLAFRKTFTMREFGRLGAASPPLTEPPTTERLRSRVAEVAGQRGLVDAPAAGEDEIPDPFGAPFEMARLTATNISVAVDAVVAALGLPPQPRPESVTGPGQDLSR
jgi:protein-tyrosine phosphatase